MKKVLLIVSIFMLFISGCDNNSVLNPSEDIQSIPVLDLDISSNEYEGLLSNKMTHYSTACKLFVDNQLYTGEIRSSGAGSRFHDKISLRIKLDNPQTLFGLHEFNLSAQVFDATMIRSVIANKIYSQMGFPLSACRNVFIKINGKDIGLYMMIERVDEDFFASRNLEVDELFKIGFETQFDFKDGYVPQFTIEKKIPDNDNFNNYIELVKAVDNTNNENIQNILAPHLNIDNYIKYHAITTLLNNDDAFTNNFFFFTDNPNAPFKIVPWDFDKLFHEGINVGLAGYNNIIKKIFSNTQTFEQYKAELKEQMRTVITKENIYPIIDSTAAVIEYAYNLDPYLGDGRFVFKKEVDDLKQEIADRIIYLEQNLDNLTQDYQF